VRGQNFAPTLLDENTILSTAYYAAYSTLHQTLAQMRMYSDGKFKLIRDYKKPNRDEFYELTNDPVKESDSQLYGVGAVLLAAPEMVKWVN